MPPTRRAADVLPSSRDRQAWGGAPPCSRDITSARRHAVAACYFARDGAATIALGRFFTSIRAIARPLAVTAHGIGAASFR